MNIEFSIKGLGPVSSIVAVTTSFRVVNLQYIKCIESIGNTFEPELDCPPLSEMESQVTVGSNL